MNPTFRQQLDAANEAYVQGDFPEAGALYRQALEANPNNPVILERLGSLALWSNDVKEAERFFTEALNALPWYDISGRSTRCTSTVWARPTIAAIGSLMQRAVSLKQQAL
jgi:tetratricopeptide (TPR) repeat protein